MIRVQVQFTDEQIRRLREQSRRQGKSVAAIVRQLVSRGLDAKADELAARYAHAEAFVGAVHDASGATDLAEAHDTYLEVALR